MTIKKLKTGNSLLSLENRLLQAILKHAPILISAKDLEGNILFTSAQFSVLDGPKPEEYVNKSVFDLFPQKIAEELWKNDLLAQKSEAPIIAEEEVFHADGSRHVYHTSKFRLLDKEGLLLGTCAVSFDITHLKTMEHHAHHDPLTELYNRHFLDTCFSSEWRRARRAKENLLFVLFDLDGFKQFNDQYGHVKGDELLVSFAEQLKVHFQRPADFCFRLGGDEFAVIFSEKDLRNAVKQVERVGQDIAKIWREENEYSCTVSTGIRVINGQDDFTSKQAYRDADVALYEVKKSGKNSTVLFKE